MASRLSEIMDKAGTLLCAVPAYAVGQEQALQVYTRKGMPAFSRPERAARAMAALVRFASISSS